MWLASPACADRDGDLPGEYRRIAVPEARLASAGASIRGARLFEAHCALCHGAGGDGHGVRREGLSRPARDFTSMDWRRSTSPRHVFYAIREGLPNSSMPSWKSLSEEDGWDMTAYVLSLAKER